MGFNWIVGLAVLMLFLNISSGAVLEFVIDPHGDKVFDRAEYRGRMYSDYNNESNDITGDFVKDINPNAGNLVDTGDETYRILDMFKLGMIQRVIKFIDNLLYGGVNWLKTLLGPSMTAGQNTIWFGSGLFPGILKLILTMSYGFMIIYFLTDKDVSQG